ncbi:hypothetical protein CBR_g37318 [Chara braunii]|uniref:Uncharacterized protein n=1 Tax=Chara braunii TaxID=69332 RepID=A0A388JZM1_CHABU|nr:hypothetical protein CBR_g37318 [Chara braunii]|eukprot:GBG63232.1 hypothetical protein CBR_g37318 [Chara braunii]
MRSNQRRSGRSSSSGGREWRAVEGKEPSGCVAPCSPALARPPALSAGRTCAGGIVYSRILDSGKLYTNCSRAVTVRDASHGAWAASAVSSRRPLGMGSSADTDTWRCMTAAHPGRCSPPPRQLPPPPLQNAHTNLVTGRRRRYQIGSSSHSHPLLASTWRGQPLIWKKVASYWAYRQATRMPREFPPAVVSAHAGFFEIFHNQVLLAAALASITAQLLKPVTSALTGRGFDWRLIMKSGGMPSSHSAAVTAMATAVGIDRGWSDPLFGICVVFACVVMYDAQGVRRAVGKHAEVLNTIAVPELFPAGSLLPGNVSPLSSESPPSSGPSTPVAPGCGMLSPSAALFGKDDEEQSLAAHGLLAGRVNRRGAGSASLSDSPLARSAPSRPETVAEIGPITPKRGRILEMLPLRPMKNLDRTERFWSSAAVEPSVQEGDVLLQEIQSIEGWRHIPLKESVGHTKLEVFVGGISGIVLTLGMGTVGFFPR